MTVSNFTGFHNGDIITLSDLQTQKEFNKMEVDFRIIEVRTYQHPESIYKYTGYLAEYKATPEADPQIIMLLLRQIDSDFDLRVYFMDTDGPTEDEDLMLMFNPLEDDLKDRFDVELFFEADDAVLPVTWDRQGPTNFGIECHSTATGDTNVKTIAEYFTNDDTRGNPHCFIEWSGDKKGGYIERWYGCDITEHDVEIFHTK